MAVDIPDALARAVEAMFQGLMYMWHTEDPDVIDAPSGRHVVRAAAVAIADAAGAVDADSRSTFGAQAVAAAFKIADERDDELQIPRPHRNALERRLQAAVDALVGIPSED